MSDVQQHRGDTPCHPLTRNPWRGDTPQNYGEVYPCVMDSWSGDDRGYLPLLAEFVLDGEGKSSAVASLNFVSKEEIHNLNKTYRDIDAPTDVLSFESDIDDDLGDIFICVEVAEENAKKFNTTLENELKLLVVHGCLHLCGYDHMNDEEAQIMESREEEILDA